MSAEQKAAQQKSDAQAATQQSAPAAGQGQATQQQEQQPQAAPQPAAQAAGQEEVAQQLTEEQLDPEAASPSGQATLAQSDTASATEDALSQPSQLSQEHAAEPQEPQLSPPTLTTAADEHIPPEAQSQVTEVSAEERLQTLLEAIRNRAWEQTGEEKATAANLQDTDLQLPASGYSEIGVVTQGRFQGQMLNPDRTFYPGQSYNPEVSAVHKTHEQSAADCCMKSEAVVLQLAKLA